MRLLLAEDGLLCRLLIAQVSTSDIGNLSDNLMVVLQSEPQYLTYLLLKDLISRASPPESGKKHNPSRIYRE